MLQRPTNNGYLPTCLLSPGMSEEEITALTADMSSASWALAHPQRQNYIFQMSKGTSSVSWFISRLSVKFCVIFERKNWAQPWARNLNEKIDCESWKWNENWKWKIALAVAISFNYCILDFFQISPLSGLTVAVVWAAIVQMFLSFRYLNKAYIWLKSWKSQILCDLSAVRFIISMLAAV